VITDDELVLLMSDGTRDTRTRALADGNTLERRDGRLAGIHADERVAVAI
jgi:hypothetical protein